MVNRKIPSKPKVVDAINNVLRTRFYIDSLENLRNITLRSLRKEEKNYVLTTSRIKKLAMSIPEIEIKMRTRRATKKINLDFCPICGNTILPLKIKNVANQVVQVGYKCNKCSFQTNMDSFSPMRYEFLFKSEKRI